MEAGVSASDDGQGQTAVISRRRAIHRRCSMRPVAKLAGFALAIAVLLGLFLGSSNERGAAQPAQARERGSYPHDEEGTPTASALDLATYHQPSPDIADRAIALLSGWVAPLVEPGTWLHFKETIDWDGGYVGAFPDGRPIPEDYISDTWYLIGDGGLVIRGIGFMYDLAGRQVQVSVFDGRAWRNLTYPIAHPQEPFPVVLDYGMAYSIETFDVSGPEWTRGSRAGRPTIEIAIHEDYPGGLDVVGYPERVIRGTLRAVFDERTGMLLSHEMLYTSEKGQERLVAVVTIAAEKADRPPDDVLRLLEEASR